MELEKRNTLILSVAQGLSITTTSINMINTGLVGAMLATNPSYSTIPLSLQFLTIALTLIPVSLLMGKFGRRSMFLLGSLAAFIGCLIIAFSIIDKSFYLFILGSIFLGFSQANQQFYRYAAADNVSNNLKSKAISLVLAGGVIAAVVGPEVSRYSFDLFPDYIYLATYLLAASIQIINFTILIFIKIKKPEVTAKKIRPLKDILIQKTLIIAILAAAVGYSLMSFIMTATPLQIVNICKLGNSASSTVIQWHIIAMFAPSFFTGSIISRFGNRKVMLVGIILYAFSVFFGILGDTVLNFWIALFLCGLGWNFLYVGGSDIIAKSALPEERAKVQGVTDFIIFVFVAMGSFLAGYLHSNLGWEIMLFYTIIPISLIFIGIIIIKPQNLKLN
ncbi:MAG: MFS transporter [Alphaproteobacteria bacterium]|nr:MFS transporter [Alphaproteobacteria bacterium]MDG1465855.1 MFS transporter [Alphaproteobacteria bacterium]MDG1882630.1 MFS transporter [Alphaproteobacteria bacterium]MDG2458317.1 MFS transporter [Alphaproteobacteria bacterium]